MDGSIKKKLTISYIKKIQIDKHNRLFHNRKINNLCIPMTLCLHVPLSQSHSIISVNELEEHS